MPRGGHNKIAINMDLVAGLYRSGTCAKDIAAMVGVSEGTVYRRLEEIGIGRRSNIEARAIADGLGRIAGTRKAPLPEESIVEDYKRGTSRSEICKAHGTNYARLRSILRSAGVPIRSIAEQHTLDIALGKRTRSGAIRPRANPEDVKRNRRQRALGANNPNWRHGKECRGYRGVVEKLICDECGSGENLAVHHIDFDHFNNATDNLRVLCIHCHLSLHKREWWSSTKSGITPSISNRAHGWRKKDSAR